MATVEGILQSMWTETGGKGKRGGIRCACVRGWTQELGGAWPVPCPICEGYGEVSREKLGRVLGESPKLLKRLDELRTRATTAARVLGKLAVILERIGK